MLNEFIEQYHLNASFAQVAQQYFAPLARRIVQKVHASTSPYFVAISGCQGSGKSTLAEYLATFIGQNYQLKVVVVSLDDFYLSSADRKTLANNIHPLFQTRGVPGTHDVALLTEVLTQLRSGASGFYLPGFNKATDEPEHKNDWRYIAEPVDLVIVEGWCLGATAVEPQVLVEPINELEQNDDANGRWRSYVNQMLALHYQPLYPLFDYWLLLKAPSFACVYQWRLEQETKLAGSNQLIEHKIMSAKQVADFIQYFQRITMMCLQQLPAKVDCQFVLDHQRAIEAVVFKQSS